MNARLLLNTLRGTGVVLTPEEDGLHVDAPAGVLTEALRRSLVENKGALIELLERERLNLKAADRRGLVIRWSEYPVWIELHDPLTGEWHEVKASECLPGIVEAAKAHRKRLRDAANRKFLMVKDELPGGFTHDAEACLWGSWQDYCQTIG